MNTFIHQSRMFTNDISDTESEFSLTSSVGCNSNVGNVSGKNDVSDVAGTSEKINYAEELNPEQVRWFYKETKQWLPFCGYDSLRLETKYRELFLHMSTTASPAMDEATSPTGASSSASSGFHDESRRERIVVRGDLYEVDVLERKGFPIYWTPLEEDQKFFLILRGIWFKKNGFQPMESEELAQKIDGEHMRLYGPQSVLPGPTQLVVGEAGTGSLDTECAVEDGQRVQTEENGKVAPRPATTIGEQIQQRLHLNVHHQVIDGLHVDWYDRDNVYYYLDSASHFFRSRLGLTKVGSNICRGYKHEARIDDKLPDISHIVFVIHGIGQKMKGGSIIYQCGRVRQLYRQVARRLFPEEDSNTGRVEFLPVDWRTCLVLDGDTVDLITLSRNKLLRSVLNSTALDILYYSSPLYRPEMMESLRQELTRIYSMFCSRAPYFEDKGGKVSVLAHSLGSVILYDLLTDITKVPSGSQCPMSTKTDNTTNRADDKSSRSVLDPSSGHKLMSNFKLDKFFCVGSPLSVFLALRGVKPGNNKDMDHLLPTHLCQRFYNIFHPSDPVVYRIEPLVNRSYAEIEPARIFRLDEYSLSYEEMPIIYNNQTQAKKKTGDKPEASLSGSGTDLSAKYASTTITGRLADFFHRIRWNPDNSKAQVETLTDITSDSEIVSAVRLERQLSTRMHHLRPHNSHQQRRQKRLSNSHSSGICDGNSSSTSNSASVSLSSLSHQKTRTRPLMSLCQHSGLTINRGFRATCREKRHTRIFEEDEGDPKSADEDQDDLTQRRHSLYQTMDFWEWHGNTNNKTEVLHWLQEDEEAPQVPVLVTHPPAPLSHPQTSNISTDSELVHLNYRLDYRLPVSRYESSLLSVLTSHTSYWTSPELCLFMLRQLRPSRTSPTTTPNQ